MNHRTPGFTLIEMMSALVLSMILVTPLFIITRDLSVQADAQKQNIHAMQQARTGLALLTEDLRRAGLGASPHPGTDPLSATRGFPTSTASDRRAVVHMPPASADTARFDSVMLVGNFFGSSAFQARVVGNDLQVNLGDLDSNSTLYCEEQFSADYAYVHVFGPKNLTIDMKVESVAYADDLCTVTVADSDINEKAFSNGDQVWVMANQAVLYQVEQVTEPGYDGSCLEGRYQLVRYYVNYEGGVCDPSTLKTDTEYTKQVVADYVQDFQVWFRPVTPVNDPVIDGQSTRLILNQDTLANHRTGEVLLPSANDHYITPTLGGSTNPDDLSCNQPKVTYGPEHVRSALVQLSVRTETPEDRLNFQSFLDDPAGTVWDESTITGRSPLFTIAPYIDVNVSGQCTAFHAEGSAYQVKTVMSEIMMPNLAARADFLATN